MSLALVSAVCHSVWGLWLRGLHLPLGLCWLCWSCMDQHWCSVSLFPAQDLLVLAAGGCWLLSLLPVTWESPSTLMCSGSAAIDVPFLGYFICLVSFSSTLPFFQNAARAQCEVWDLKQLILNVSVWHRSCFVRNWPYSNVWRIVKLQWHYWIFMWDVCCFQIPALGILYIRIRWLDCYSLAQML